MRASDIIASAVSVDESGITQRFASGEVCHIAWGDLTDVSVITTASGPYFEDVFVELLGRDEGYCVVPQCSAAMRELVPRLLNLPGFDSAAFGQAMASTEDATFLCWRTSPHF